ncbi:uncharacterized protein L3040_002084 [Drepanopeziza brunnea f. sp. 'multigermtubi']|uniref:Phosphoglycerate mutase n=1 Tax=Marssonina brunnea f. sp. multigermtubi (strain MB_m1) TaxID=1072389 RepID=K1X119_MARBU|nr:phosphoglycerate mutase [Drepanopeziza brunnea f. sp. 'multigermtubi' MB_m1]EKD18657.1 phosphoglycerate mutase [Drepanopeziza brunnea f. sp. 'multigermtubi' MB_m1]KAJ5052332.1 hypothetical protein L3040_002084 [Drepanopeziza brunnea f. sp. 'multigermtubi']
MGWPPAVVIVVRHGARLDAADKQWHLTSPTPYDPPLTYGGWTQSRVLGARIASILRSRETDDEVISSDVPTRKRRHKVVIHSSPFLRCVQTSVAISAGLAQNPGHTHRHHKPPSSPSVKATAMHSSPRIRPSVVIGSPSLVPIPEPVGSKPNGRSSEQPENIKKSTVRVDAFLGEWLSPDYFEHITPPPSSVMMVAGAKADLLRREDYSSLSHMRDPAKAPVGFPGGWGSPVATTGEKKEDEGALSTLPSLGQSLPRRDRTSSLSSVGSNVSRQSHRSGTSHSPAAEHGIYQPPIPSYAISSADPIPAGYVAHSRDACVDVDYQWDSMREPQNWGNGGEYGEEWSSMHKRFRKGLDHLVSWYSESDDPAKLFTKSPNRQTVTSSEDNVEDEDTDLVVILVTHGAGCNALIGALTNQPVLLDVGMASLTMAVRKPTPPTSPTTTPMHSRSSSRTVLISDKYDVKLVANTEHLRSSSTTPSSRSQSVAGLPIFRESIRERYASPSSLDGSSSVRSRPVPQSSNFGSIRRTASIAGSTPRNYTTPVRQTSIGLWSAPRPEEDHVEEEPEDDMILNFGDNATAAAEKKGDEQKEAEVPIENEKVQEAGHEYEEDDVAPLGGGLWGSPRPPGLAEKMREIAPKRRWTVNERS